MFTGIVEQLGQVLRLAPEAGNLRVRLTAPWVSELRIDQSIAHDGACLTVVALDASADTPWYEVVAVGETLERTTLGRWAAGHRVNLERCLRVGDRLDGHFVQGHVDARAQVLAVNDLGGSWALRVALPREYAHLVVPKGSICINGVSLTVVEASADYFTVVLIPYTWEHTNLHLLKAGDAVNLEFDLLGKYFHRWQQLQPSRDEISPLTQG